MTAFADTRRGNRVALWDTSAERWLPPLLLLEDPRPCEADCCNAYAIRGTNGRPVRVHASNSAEVRVVPKPRAADAFPDPSAAYKAALEDQINDENES